MTTESAEKVPEKTTEAPAEHRTLGRDFGRRLLTALIGGPLIIWIIYTGAPFFAIAVLLVAALAAYEMNNIVRPGHFGIAMLEVMTFATIAAVMLQAPLVLLTAIIVTVAIGIVESLMMEESKLRYFWRNWVFLIAGGLYVGLPMALLLVIRDYPDGRWWVGVLFAANWATDGFALIGGRLFGRTKLAPQISPGKTVEGVRVGVLAGVLIGMAVGVLLLKLAPLPVFIASVVVALLTVVGDLLESWLKRTFQVKDSGAILPGHGGILDRIDGLLLATPGLFIVLLFFGIW